MDALLMQYLITIEGGHGMDTYGKRTPNFSDGSHMKENEFNDVVVAYIREIFADTPNVEVFDCATEWGDTALSTRVQRANAKYYEYKKKYGADGFKSIHISIHANAYLGRWGTWGGQGVFYNTGSAEGQKLATSVLTELLNGTPLRNRGIKAENFYMVKYTVAPAILVEAAFMDNLEEAELLVSDAFRREVAKEVSEGAAKYMGFKIKVKAPVPSPYGRRFYRVVVGSYEDRANAMAQIAAVKAKGFSAFLTIVDIK